MEWRSDLTRALGVQQRGRKRTGTHFESPRETANHLWRIARLLVRSTYDQLPRFGGSTGHTVGTIVELIDHHHRSGGRGPPGFDLQLEIPTCLGSGMLLQEL